MVFIDQNELVIDQNKHIQNEHILSQNNLRRNRFCDLGWKKREFILSHKLRLCKYDKENTVKRNGVEKAKHSQQSIGKVSINSRRQQKGLDFSKMFSNFEFHNKNSKQTYGKESMNAKKQKNDFLFFKKNQLLKFKQKIYGLKAL